MTTPLEDIKKLYYTASKRTIQRDFERAIDLLKSMPTEEERERAAVYMDGLAQMRSQWAGGEEEPHRRHRPGRSRTRSTKG